MSKSPASAAIGKYDTSGASERTRRSDTAEERADDIADAQRDQLGVWIVTPAAHAVGDNRRHERLDRSEHRDRERRRQQLADHLQAQLERRMSRIGDLPRQHRQRR